MADSEDPKAAVVAVVMELQAVADAQAGGAAAAEVQVTMRTNPHQAAQLPIDITAELLTVALVCVLVHSGSSRWLCNWD